MFKIVFEDDFLMVLDKSAGVVVTSTETHKDKTLEDILKTKHEIKVERGGIVHRLDKDTSGLLLVAKNSAVLEHLQDQFKTRVVKKQYLALVHGLILEKNKVDIPIARNPGDREKFIASQTSFGVAREAVTEFEPLKSLQFTTDRLQEIFPDFSKIQFRRLITSHYSLFTLLSVHPLTGRTHQIRVHLKYINHPVVGDEKYAGRKTARLDHRWCPRQFLHAARIEVTHPVTCKRMVFESELPEDLQKVCQKLTPYFYS